MKFFINLLLLFSLVPLNAQDPSTRGKEFWFTFMPNSHNAGTADHRIVVMAYEPTNVQLEYTNRIGVKKSANFTVDNIDLTYVYKVQEGMGFEMSKGVSNAELNDTPMPSISDLTYHITSDKEIELLIINSSETSSDACLVLPIHGIDKEYFIQSYYSINSTGWGSQFALIATEDSTEIVILPSDMIEPNITSLTKSTLNRGEVYFARGDMSFDNASDLTGTRVISNKPIYCYSGHKRARVPQNIAASQDHLITNVMPVGFTGVEYLTFPLGKGVIDDQYFVDDSVRVVAFEDGTDIYFNSTKEQTIDKGNFVSFPLEKSFLIKTNKPIACYEIKQSSGPSTGGGGNNISDPFLISIPSFEQYSNQFTFYNFDMLQRDSISPVFIDHFIGIAIPESGLSSLRLDGVLIEDDIDIDSYKDAVKEGYVYFNYKVSPGRHTINSDEKFCCIVYGYGTADSYGYTANGFKIFKIDPEPPKIKAENNCYEVKGNLYKNNHTMESLASVNTNDSENITLTWNSSSFSSHTISYSASLTNVYQDGHYYLQSEDVLGQKYLFERVNIQGFTVKIEDTEPENEMLLFSDTLPMNTHICFKLPIENYGKYKQENLNIYVESNHSKIYLTSNTITTLDPNEKDFIELCYTPDYESGTFSAKLMIENGCIPRQIAQFRFISKEDKDPPKFLSESDKCRTITNISIFDSTYFDMGIKQGVITQNVNTFITENSAGLPQQLSYQITIDDPYQDAIYHLTIEDIRGNITEIIDTIPGFTLDFNGDNTDDSKTEHSNSTTLNFEGMTIGFKKCDTLKLYNYGFFPIEFNSAYIFENFDFSIPDSQFPITIEPNSEYNMIICFRPSNSLNTLIEDSIRFDFKCLEAVIDLDGFGQELEAISNTLCDVSIGLKKNSIPTNFFADNLYPNPASTNTQIYIGNPVKQNITIELYNNYGYKVQELLNQTIEPGIVSLDVKFNDLPSGSYFYIIKTLDNQITKRLMIKK